MSLIVIIPIGIFAIFALIIFMVFLRYIPLIERNAFDVPRFQVPDQPKNSEGLKIRNIQIPYDTRCAIEAKYIKSRKPSKKLVVFCHETGADLDSWQKHAHFLPDDEVDVLTFNFKLLSLRPKSESVDEKYFQWPTVRDLRCLERVLSWVAVEKKDYEVALFGVSKGATVAAAAAPSPIIKSVLLDGAFSTHMTMQKYMKKFVNIYVSPRSYVAIIPDWIYLILSYMTLAYASIKNRLRFFSMENFIPKLRKPVFMIHAGKDYHVQLDHVQRLMSIIPGSTDLWVAEKAGHSETVLKYPQEYNQRITSFLKKTLND
ncbi:MAG: pimeloyl-ACP methyl ester carboxylesterase [Candidatus Omnitrophota bacterium]|jgi:pimeloyl-ACP methyl ester carboxylesterase